jgi:DnaJ-domain-containing protein 1
MDSQVFSVKQAANLFKTQIDESDKAYCDYIRRYADKNFAYSIRLAGGFVIYPRDADKTKRRFFLDCLITNFNKNRKSKIFFNTEKDLPILVEFIADASKLKDTFVFARMQFATLSLRVYNPSALIFMAIEAAFKGEKKQIDLASRVIKVNLFSAQSRQKAKKLLQGGLKVDETFVRFIFSEEELSAFCENSGQKSYYIDRFSDSAINAHFRALDAMPGDSFEKIKASYVRLAKEYHPDNVFGKDERTVHIYTEKFRVIQAAFESIKSHYQHAC